MACVASLIGITSTQETMFFSAHNFSMSAYSVSEARNPPAMRSRRVIKRRLGTSRLTPAGKPSMMSVPDGLSSSM
jgi:hypothetical protein